MKTKSFLSFLIIGIILSACDTKPKSAYYSHDLQMETLRGKVNRVDYNFYKDRNCNKRYSTQTPYSLAYDEKGNLVSDSRYVPFDDVERDENGFFVHVYTGYDVAPEEHTEWDMIELSYTYNEEGFVSTSFKAGMDADCGKRTYFYKDSLPSRVELGEGDGYIDYEIIKTDGHKNWTLARVDVNYNEYDMDGDMLRNVRDNYYIQRKIMYSQDDPIPSNESEKVDYEESEEDREASNAAYQELLQTGEEFERACDLYNRELNKIPDKAFKAEANHGLYAEAVCWDCDDAFRLVEKKGAAFAKAMRKCGQEDNARELERRLKADKRKYESYKDEVYHMLGVY